MQDYGLVSIITPSWNCGKFVAETIQSILAQTYTNWELLFQDDCSTDNTREIVARYADNDSRIKYACNPTNSGAAITRNNALLRAKGRWIAFLDSDDLWLPEKLERQLAFMVDNNYAFTYHEYTEINESGEKLNVYVSGPAHITEKGMFTFCWLGCLTVMYDKQKVGLVQIRDIRKNNDYAMWLKVIPFADCYLLSECLANYRRGRKGSVSTHGYMELVKWHYRLFRYAENKTIFAAIGLTVVNMICGIYKKVRYVSKMVV